MNNDLLLILLLLSVTIVLFMASRPRMDVVAILMLTLMPLFGLVTLPEALSGFSDPNIILIAALFVVGESLVRTGVAQRIGDLLVKRAGRSEARLIALLMLATATIGSVMSSTGVVAIFIPIVLRIAANARIAPARLMMPLSTAGLISGMMTLVATAPNLVVQSQLVRNGHEGFSFFAFAPIGIPVLTLAILYMLLVRRWLAPNGQAAPSEHMRPRLGQWVEEYALAERQNRLLIETGSAWAGAPLDKLNLRSAAGVNILAIERRDGFRQRLIRPAADTVLLAGDILLLDLVMDKVAIDRLCEEAGLRRLSYRGEFFADHPQDFGLAQVLIPPESYLVDNTLAEARFRTETGLTVVGLKRGATALPGPLAHQRLEMGDTLLVAGSWKAIRNLRLDRRGLIPLELPAEMDEILEAPSRAPAALAILALVVALMVSGAIPNVLAALIGCLLLGAFRCIDMESAYRSIHWQSLILIVGMFPFSIALQKSGGMDLAAEMLLTAIGGSGERTALAALFVLTAIAGLFISNTATAILMAPVAITVASELGVSPYPFAMTVALAASTAFMTPVSSPVNTLVVGPGNYRFVDFLRIGVPFALICMAVTVLLVPVFFPFR